MFNAQISGASYEDAKLLASQTQASMHNEVSTWQHDDRSAPAVRPPWCAGARLAGKGSSAYKRRCRPAYTAEGSAQGLRPL